MSAHAVVIGGGLAAATAVEELRALGYDGSIDLVTDESHWPYQRPPLSKGYLTGSDARESVFAHPPGFSAALRYTFVTALAYPLVVLGLTWCLRLRAPRTSEGAYRLGRPN